MNLNDYNCVVMLEPYKLLRLNQHHELHVEIIRWISQDLTEMPIVIVFMLDLDTYDHRVDVGMFSRVLELYLEEYHCEILWDYVIDKGMALCINMLPLHKL